MIDEPFSAVLGLLLLSLGAVLIVARARLAESAAVRDSRTVVGHPNAWLVLGAIQALAGSMMLLNAAT